MKRPVQICIEHTWGRPIGCLTEMLDRAGIRNEVDLDRDVLIVQAEDAERAWDAVDLEMLTHDLREQVDIAIRKENAELKREINELRDKLKYEAMLDIEVAKVVMSSDRVEAAKRLWEARNE